MVCSGIEVGSAGCVRVGKGMLLSLHGNGEEVLCEESYEEVGDEECGWGPGLLAGVYTGSWDDGGGEGEL